MRLVAMAIALCGLIGAGCARSEVPRPPADRATLVVKVVAEPKAGAGERFSSDYTPAASPGYGNSKFAQVDYPHLTGIVVWIEPMDGQPSQTTPSLPVVVEFEPLSTAPTTVHAATVGSTVTLHNRGGKSVPVYSVSDGNEFELGPLMPGADARYVCKSAGLLEVLTPESVQPVARIYVAPGILARSAAAGERATFENLPPGSYRVGTWHERLPGSESTVTLPAGKVTQTTAKVGVNALPKIPSPR